MRIQRAFVREGIGVEQSCDVVAFSGTVLQQLHRFAFHQLLSAETAISKFQWCYTIDKQKVDGIFAQMHWMCAGDFPGLEMGLPVVVGSEVGEQLLYVADVRLDNQSIEEVWAAEQHFAELR